MGWLTFAMEGEVFGEMSTFVVPSEEVDAFRIADLQAVEIEKTLHRTSEIRSRCKDSITHLNAKATSIYVISQEEVRVVCWVAADLEDLQKVVLYARFSSTRMDERG